MKILSAETNLASATNVSNAPVVRLFNSGASNILVTQKDYQGANEGTFMVMSGDVVYCEKYFTDTLEGSADVKATKVAYSSMMSFVGQDSAGPTYTHSVSATNVDEGGSFTTTITTTNVDDGTNLYWELSGTNVTSADFSSGALTGTASISSNSATFSHTVDEDTLTEGTEIVTIKVYSDSGRNTQVGNTLTVTLADTSTTPVFNTKSVSYDGNDAVIFPMNSSSLDWGASESATFECWFKINAYTGSWNALFGRWKGGQYGFLMEISNDGKAFFAIGNGSGYYANMESSSGDVSAGTWYHIAAVKTGTTGAMYLNGTSIATTNSWNQGHSNSTRDIVLGGNADSYTAYGLDGYLTDVRFTVGQALYSGNFTPNTSPLTTTSQGAVASAVKFLGSQSSTTTAAIKVLNGNASDTATVFGDPTISSDLPY